MNDVATTAALLEIVGVSKAFAGLKALDDARLRVGHGEVHALIGQNGAGKSTLIKILTGAYRRDSGTVKLDGADVQFATPLAAQRAGISTIYQEVNLVLLRSVAENIFMGREPMRFGLIDWKRMNAQANKLLERFGIHTDVTRPLGESNIAVQQMVAIARAVSTEAKLVVMDEPTSSLDDGEVETLFAVIRQLKASGVSVIFVSHRLDELYAVCDRVTIMRDGRTVRESRIDEISKLELVAEMLGRSASELSQTGQTGFAARGSRVATAPRLRVSQAKRSPALRQVSLEVQSGETVGLAGLLGAGRSETARVVFGADSLEAGALEFEGQPLHLRYPADAIRAGIGFCSEDRKLEGIVPELSVRENLTLALMPQLTRNGIVDRKAQLEITNRYIKLLGIKTSGPEQRIRELSGGNQQKVLLARWLCLQPKLLILDEPTRGIDVGAKGEIQRLIGSLSTEGLSVLMISSELEELTEGCDRVMVLRDGSSVGELRGETLNQANIMQAMAHGIDQPIQGEV